MFDEIDELLREMLTLIHQAKISYMLNNLKDADEKMNEFMSKLAKVEKLSEEIQNQIEEEVEE